MSTTFYDVTATTAVFRSTASTTLGALSTQSPCIGSLDCYDVASTAALIPPTASTSSVAPTAESLCSGYLTCYGKCVSNFINNMCDLLTD